MNSQSHFSVSSLVVSLAIKPFAQGYQVLLTVKGGSSGLLGFASKPQISWFILNTHGAGEPTVKGPRRLAHLGTVQSDEWSSIRGFGKYKHVFT